MRMSAEYPFEGQAVFGIKIAGHVLFDFVLNMR
jgi:hypothetical protein